MTVGITILFFLSFGATKGCSFSFIEDGGLEIQVMELGMITFLGRLESRDLCFQAVLL
jgi:hypothetical protein